ncbi:MAG: THUMP domain-containing class I SAM-dependent RNA methyltransferase [Parvularcula sp.]
MEPPFTIVLLTAPGLESLLADEARALSFRNIQQEGGGVSIRGDWADVRRANFLLRGASRVLVRIAQFPAVHLSRLDKSARRVEWGAILPPKAAIRVEASCRGSKIYHSGAAAERVGNAAAKAVSGEVTKDAKASIYVRIEKNKCTISLDTSGELLHRRGFKQAVAKAPMRETMAALFLRACGYDGKEPVLDPMCGSGTIPIEAAEVAAGLAPGRARHFAFEYLANHDSAQWAEEKRSWSKPLTPEFICMGTDKAASAVESSRANADRAGVSAYTRFEVMPIRDLENGFDRPGLVLINPPYGARIGDAKSLRPLYQSIGRVLRERFCGWRCGIVTTSEELVAATGLPFEPYTAKILHGSLRVRLYGVEEL